MWVCCWSGEAAQRVSDTILIIPRMKPVGEPHSSPCLPPRQPWLTLGTKQRWPRSWEKYCHLSPLCGSQRQPQWVLACFTMLYLFIYLFFHALPLKTLPCFKAWAIDRQRYAVVFVEFEGSPFSCRVRGASVVALTVKICLQCGRSGFYPRIGKNPWRRKWQPTPVFLPGEFHGQRNLVGYNPWGCKGSDSTDQQTVSLLTSLSFFKVNICT